MCNKEKRKTQIFMSKNAQRRILGTAAFPKAFYHVCMNNLLITCASSLFPFIN